MARRLRTTTLAGATLLALVATSFSARTAQAQPAPPAQPRPAPPAAPPAPPVVAPAPPVAAPPPPDLPPPPPPPWTANPNVVGQAEPPPAPPSPPAPGAERPAPPLLPPAGVGPVAPYPNDTWRDHERRLAELDLLLRQHEERERREHEDREKWWGWTKSVKFSGYIQPQLLWQWYDTAQGSPNATGGVLPAGVGPNDVIAKADTTFGAGAPGLTTNGNYFRLRRARLKTELEPNDWTRLVFEFDPIAAGGPDNATGTIARNVEAQGIAHWSHDVVTTFGMGIFKIPYGWEVLQSDADRPFIERSWWEQNVTPGEFDTGIKAYTTALQNKLTVQVAVINGATQGEKTFSLLPDLNKGKDAVGRVNYNFGPVDVGASGYYGQGQEVSLSQLAFKQFPRYAWNFEAALHHRFLKLGETRLLAEFDRGQNMDRGTRYNPTIVMPGLPADIVNGQVVNKDELGMWARVEQDVTHWVTVAARLEVYSPDTAQGLFIDGRTTEAFVGVFHFTKALQTMLEYDHFTDNVHMPGSPLPYVQGNMASGVLQARFP
ncbi:MAG TPA: porin [Polyangiaceae bacterium]|jgi:hypothetical protein